MENALTRKELLELALSGVKWEIGNVKHSITVNPDLVEAKCYDVIELNKKREMIEAELNVMSDKEQPHDQP